jgi:hypothetical protein
VRQPDHFAVFNAGHRLRSNHRIDDGLFRGFHSPGKNGIERVIRQQFQVNYSFPAVCMGIRRRERNENVARSIARNASVTPQSQ